jgi:putative ABC transport system substrate-binding protein
MPVREPETTMRRRQFISLLGGTVAAGWPESARTQQAVSTRKVAVLMGAAQSVQGETYLAAFLRRLDELGWKKDRNIRTDVRWWTAGPDRMETTIAELVASSPDVIMVFSNLALALLKPRAGIVPVVFVGVGDPIGEGFVSSLAHPGGNITGFAGFDGPIGGKWLELLKETAPQMTRVLAILHPDPPIQRAFRDSIEAAAPRLNVEATIAGVRNAADIENAISAFAAKGNGGIIIAPHAVTWANGDRIVAQALRHRLPSLYGTAESVTAGGLVSYGYDFEDTFRKTAEYVDRILRGEKPRDLPVQHPTKFKLSFNLKTAKAIGLTISPALLNRADEVIE